MTVRPELVVEIAYDGLQRSTRYPAGVTLRFARVIRYREDKRPEDADTVETLLAAHPGKRDAPVKRSAGLLLFRHTDDGLEVLLGHMGGPFFARRDAGAWTVPKGEYEPDEPAWEAARREFQEELGLPPPDGEAVAAGRGPADRRQDRHGVGGRGRPRPGDDRARHVPDGVAAAVGTAPGVPRAGPGGVVRPRPGAAR